ncbi:hypothetical protein K469DRAFT_744590 [Zopfia rhizophila CBS 207.26]|uniref:Anaphase-promoting complex subunit 4 n=1 Tax=Zopfia rhizophila CBS 207.26 TaxID=1314779 RepID=A0A6A6EU24_9PEZI|nr:hypothetical protein K469DRAFT_744590 [Zopfia rhizophila CBS 207.26]
MAGRIEHSTGPKLLQQAEKILLHPIRPHLISYCPTMDLIAVVTDEENLDVYRINGQRSFGIKRKNSRTGIDFICWKFNGQSIAVAWSDGLMDIISAETGKILQKDVPPPATAQGSRRIQYIGWGLNFINVEAVKRRTGIRKKKTNGSAASIDFTSQTTEDWDAFKDDITLDDFLQRQPDLQALNIAPDLPDQLAMTDMETLLAKLPAIPLPPTTPFMRPMQQADAGAFSSQAQVDAIFHSHHMKDHNAVDMLVRCMENGTVHPSIYDSLETIDVGLPPEWPLELSKQLLHASHPYSSSHGLLMELKLQGRTLLAFVPLTLGFVPSAGVYLHLISSKTAQLQNLLLYIQQCLQRVRNFWKHSQDLPSKFMMNISETLEEKKLGDLVQNLYHLACTGNCPPTIKNWLVDELAEAGHKRWDHTVMSSLTTLIALLHENLLPALDRCSIVISRLRGLAQYHDSGWIFSAPVTDFTSLLTLLSNLRLLAHTALLYAGDEKRQFATFSKWLRYEIDFEATEPGSQGREEMESRDPGVDIGMVLEYIRYGLTKSDLAPYFRPETELAEEQQKAPPCGYDDTRKAIDSLKEEASYKEEALCLDRVLRHSKEQCGKLFHQISQWQEASTSMNCGLVLEDGEATNALDMRMIFEKPPKPNTKSKRDRKFQNAFKKLTITESPTEDTISTYITTVLATSKSHLHIHRLTHSPIISSLSKSVHTLSSTTLDFSTSEIIDAKFADDKAVLILLQPPSDSSPLILSIPYTPTTTSPIVYTPIPPTNLPSLTLPSGAAPPNSLRQIISFNTASSLKPYVKHVFEGRFTPLKIVVNGRKGRRVVVVLGSDRKHYRVLDLDFKGRREGVDERGDEDEEMESSSDGSDIEMVGA